MRMAGCRVFCVSSYTFIIFIITKLGDSLRHSCTVHKAKVQAWATCGVDDAGSDNTDAIFGTMTMASPELGGDFWASSRSICSSPTVSTGCASVDGVESLAPLPQLLSLSLSSSLPLFVFLSVFVFLTLKRGVDVRTNGMVSCVIGMRIDIDWMQSLSLLSVLSTSLELLLLLLLLLLFEKLQAVAGTFRGTHGAKQREFSFLYPYPSALALPLALTLVGIQTGTKLGRFVCEKNSPPEKHAPILR